MKKSITAKLFVMTALLLGVFLLFTLIFQLVFFEKFYIAEREQNIKNGMNVFISKYSECKDSEASAIDLIDKFEQKNEVAVIIFNTEMESVYRLENENNENINLIDKEKITEMLQNSFSTSEPIDQTFTIGFSRRDKGSDEKYISYYINTFPINDNETAYVIYTHKEMTEAKEAIIVIYKYFIAASVIFILLISVLYAKMISHPLIKLNKAAAKMSKLDFSQKITVNREDEIGRLGSTLNFLSQNLDKSLCELHDANSKLQNDIDKEKELAKMRKEFIATVSHELKTPLALIGGYAQAFKDNIVKEDSKDFYSEVILDETKKMSDMVSKMLKLTELESDYVKISEDKFPVSSLAEIMVKKFLPVAAIKRINIENRITGTQIVCADREKIEQVFENLLTNAIKHTPEGGNIKMWDESTENVLIVNIENTGSHIPENEIDCIWDMFYRGKKANRDNSTGLGLAIVKKILDLQKSDYSVKNTENGVCFSLTMKTDALF